MKFENLSNERDIGVLIDLLVEKIGNPEAVLVYEAFNEDFKNTYEHIKITNPSVYNKMKRDYFEDLLIEKYGFDVVD